MKRLSVLITIVWIVFPMLLRAQDAPKVEVFAGYPHLQGENSAQILAAQGTLTYSPLKWFSLVGDAGIQFGEVFADTSVETFLAGPEFSFRAPNRRFRVFAHALAGGATSPCAGFGPTGCERVMRFADAYGGGVDIPVHRRLAIRTQVDALRTRFADKTQNYTRASFGVVIPIGKRGYLSSE
jgi:hypothetical protein